MQPIISLNHLILVHYSLYILDLFYFIASYFFNMCENVMYLYKIDFADDYKLVPY